MTEKIIIVGAGGHGRVVLDTCRAAGLPVAGFLDTVQQTGMAIHGVTVLGDNGLLDDAAFLKAHRFIVAIGHQDARAALSQRILENGGTLATVIHPSCIVSPTARIGAGTVLIAGVIVNTDARIGDYCIVNTAATIDHDNVLENGVQICPGAHLAGKVHCANSAFIGTGATVLPGIRIGRESIVGAGAVVVRDVADKTMVMGNPAKAISAGN